MRVKELLGEMGWFPDIGGAIYDFTHPPAISAPAPAGAGTPAGQTKLPTLTAKPKQTAGINPNGQAKPEPPPFNPQTYKDMFINMARQMGITAKNDLAHLIGNASVETGNWKSAIEWSHWSDPVLVHKKLTSNFPTVEIAKYYIDLNNPVAFANRAYANKNGNGDEASGDGWRYRGRAFLHITGKGNYLAVGKKAHPENPTIYVNNPEILSTNPTEGAKASIAWFLINNLKGKSDRQVTVGINGTTALNNKERGQASMLAKKELSKNTPQVPHRNKSRG